MAKDITPSNPNSLRLLVGEAKIKEDPGALQRVAASFTLQTLKLDEPEEIYDQDRKLFINYDEKYKAKFDAAQNLTSSSNFSKVFSLNLGNFGQVDPGQQGLEVRYQIAQAKHERVDSRDQQATSEEY